MAKNRFKKLETEGKGRTFLPPLVSPAFSDERTLAALKPIDELTLEDRDTLQKSSSNRFKKLEAAEPILEPVRQELNLGIETEQLSSPLEGTNRFKDIGISDSDNRFKKLETPGLLDISNIQTNRESLVLDRLSRESRGINRFDLSNISGRGVETPSSVFDQFGVSEIGTQATPIAEQPPIEPIGVQEVISQVRVGEKLPFVGSLLKAERVSKVIDSANIINGTKTTIGGSQPVSFGGQQFVPTREAREVTEGDKVAARKIVEDYIAELDDRQERGITIKGRIAEGVLELPAFMVEFIATAGAFSGAKKATQEAAERILGRAAQKTAGKIAVKTAGVAIGTAARTSLMGTRILEQFQDRRFEGVEFTESGNVLIKEAEESPFKSFAKSVGDVYIENLSEIAGPVIGKAGSKVVNKVGTKFPIAGKAFNGIRDAWLKLNVGKNAPDFISEVIEKGGWNGFLEELGEEQLGRILRAVTGIEGEGNIFERLVQSVPNKEEFLIEAGVLSIPGITKGIAGLATGPRRIEDGPTQRIGEIGPKISEGLGVQISPEEIARLDKLAEAEDIKDADSTIDIIDDLEGASTEDIQKGLDDLNKVKEQFDDLSDFEEESLNKGIKKFEDELLVRETRPKEPDIKKSVDVIEQDIKNIDIEIPETITKIPESAGEVGERIEGLENSVRNLNEIDLRVEIEDLELEVSEDISTLETIGAEVASDNSITMDSTIGEYIENEIRKANPEIPEGTDLTADIEDIYNNIDNFEDADIALRDFIGRVKSTHARLLGDDILNVTLKDVAFQANQNSARRVIEGKVRNVNAKFEEVKRSLDKKTRDSIDDIFTKIINTPDANIEVVKQDLKDISNLIQSSQAKVVKEVSQKEAVEKAKALSDKIKKAPKKKKKVAPSQKVAIDKARDLSDRIKQATKEAVTKKDNIIILRNIRKARTGIQDINRKILDISNIEDLKDTSIDDIKDIVTFAGKVGIKSSVPLTRQIVSEVNADGTISQDTADKLSTMIDTINIDLGIVEGSDVMAGLKDSIKTNIKKISNKKIRTAISDFSKKFESSSGSKLTKDLSNIFALMKKDLQNNFPNNDDYVNDVIPDDVFKVLSGDKTIQELSIEGSDVLSDFITEVQRLANLVNEGNRIIVEANGTTLSSQVLTTDDAKEQIAEVANSLEEQRKDDKDIDRPRTPIKKGFRGFSEFIKNSWDTVAGVNNLTPHYLINRLSGWDLKNIVGRIGDTNIREGIHKANDLRETLIRKFRTFLESENIESSDLAKMSDQFRGIFSRTKTKLESIELGDKGLKFKLSEAEILDIYLVAQQLKGRRHLQEKGVYFEKTKSGKLSVEQIAGIEERVQGDETLIKIAEFMTNSLNNTSNSTDVDKISVKDAINSVSKITHGRNRANEDNYWALETFSEPKLVGKEIVMSLIEDGGFLQKRTAGTRPIIVRDAFSRYLTTIDAASEYYGMAMPLRSLKFMINDKAFTDITNKKGYSKEREALIEIFKNAESSTKRNKMSVFINALQGKLARGLLNLNPAVVALQPMSMFNYKAKTDASIWATVFKQMDVGEKGKRLKIYKQSFDEMLEHSSFFFDRWMLGHQNIELAEAGKTDAVSKAFQGKSLGANKLGIFMKMADSIGLIMGWKISKAEVSRKNLTEESKDFWDDWEARTGKERSKLNKDGTKKQQAEYWDAVRDRAEFLWTTTQPTFDAWNRTVNTSDRAAGPRLVFFIFRSFWDKSFGVSTDQVARMNLSKDSKRVRLGLKNLGAIYIGLVLASFLKDMVRNLLGDDKDLFDITTDAIFTGLNIFPVLGKKLQDAIKIGIQTAVGKKKSRFFGTSALWQNIIDKIFRAGLKIFTGAGKAATQDDIADGLEVFIKKGLAPATIEAAKVGSLLLGVNPATAQKLVEGYGLSIAEEFTDMSKSEIEDLLGIKFKEQSIIDRFERKIPESKKTKLQKRLEKRSKPLNRAEDRKKKLKARLKKRKG